MRIIIIIMLLSVISIFAQNNNNLTIYNGGFSVVKTNTEYDLKKGINKLIFKDFSDQIEINSLNLDIKAKQLEKSFINIQPDINLILKKYVGKNIKLIAYETTIEGVLISIDNGVIIKTIDNKFVLVNDIKRFNIFFDEMLLDLEKKKEFFFVVESENSSKEKAQISYVTNGLGWNTEYIAYLDKDSKKMNLEGWVNLENNTGIDFENTSVKFVAGEVERISNNRRVSGFFATEDRAYSANLKSFEDIQPKTLGELYTYSYPRNISLLKNEIKQLPLISKKEIGVQNKYNYYSNEYSNNETNIDVVVEIKNDEKNGVGIPIPAGNIKIFKQDGDTYEMIGANVVNHTAKNEILRIKTGTSFDLLGKSEVIETRNIAENVNESTREITLKNRKDEDITIEVIAYLPRNYEIISSEEKYTKENASSIKYSIKVSKNSEKKFKFTYRTKW